jgi:sec-independent protein translocase protein TatB
VFDLGFGEILVIALVVLIVMGPRELPRLLRTAGQGLSRLRTMSRDLRAQSGIDDLIREEGLEQDLRALRSLSKGKVVDAIVNDAMAPPRAATSTAPKPESPPTPAEGAPNPAPGAAAAEGAAAEPASSDVGAAATTRNEAMSPAPSPVVPVERERLGVPVPTPSPASDAGSSAGSSAEGSRDP